ncbi:MAG TPA: LysE family translocator [Dehalococcoidia bacterium]|nr:LysE family translocator [Dehalococcoidia bacterium]
MPGPSLALIVRNTLFGGRRYGVATGIGHGIGFGIYAFLAATGIAVTLKSYPEIDNFLRVTGVVILLYLAQSFIRSASKTEDSSLHPQGKRDANSRVAFIQGFSVAFFNPKILLTMYSPFVEATMSNLTLIGMGILGMCTDGLWYITVATVLSTSGLLERLRQREIMVTRTIGVILFLYAIFLLFRFGWVG